MDGRFATPTYHPSSQPAFIHIFIRLALSKCHSGQTQCCSFASQRNFARLGLASSYLAQGKLAEAEAEIAIMAGILGKIAPDEVAISRPAAAQQESLSGSLKMARGDAAAAANHFRRSIELLLPRQHPQSPYLASARADLALALAKQGDRMQATALATQARAVFTQHPDVAPHLRKSLIETDALLKRGSR